MKTSDEMKTLLLLEIRRRTEPVATAGLLHVFGGSVLPYHHPMSYSVVDSVCSGR